MTTLIPPIAKPRVGLDEIRALGEFVEPVDARAMVIFAHGCGSARHSKHDRYLAGYLNCHGFGTVLLDVLTPREEAVDVQSGAYRSNVELLAHRLIAASDKVANLYEPDLPIVYVGVGAGAAAALIAAARRPGYVQAVICRSGLPDLADPELRSVRAPTLLLVGSDESKACLESNQRTQLLLECEHELLTIPGATHCFEEPGTFDKVTRAIFQWLDKRVPAAPIASPW